MRKLKGLYWWFKYSQRVIPLTLRGWKTLLTVASMWETGDPKPAQFGNYLLLLTTVVDDSLRQTTIDALDYNRESASRQFAVFQVYPIGTHEIVEHLGSDSSDPLYQPSTIGWKQTYEWRAL